MTNWARVAALVAAGVTLGTMSLRAADRAAYGPTGDASQVKLISANEDFSPRDDVAPEPTNSATYPPKKAKRPAAKPAPSSTDADSDADPTLAPKSSTAPRANSAARRSSAQQLAQADPRPAVRHRVTPASARLNADGEAMPAPTPKSAMAPKSTMSQPMTPSGPSSEYSSDGHAMMEGGESCPDCDSCVNCIHWCGGVEYLLLKPRFSNDSALSTSTVGGVGTPTSTTATNNVDFQYDYNSDYHVFVGVGTQAGGVRFGYWRMQDSANESATASGNFAGGAGTAVQGVSTSQIIIPGSTLNVTSHIHVDLYDIDRLQHLELPSAGCGAGWDVNWLYGVRIGNVHRTIDEFDPIETVNIGSSFVGAGPRIGLEGHRNLGGSRFSTFVSADAALLVGTFKGSFRRTTPGLLQDTVETNDTNQERVVPNFGLSLGLSWNPTCNTSLTAGYMVEAFGDAIGNNGASGCPTCGTQGNPGTGNILSFDGIFVRMQHCF